MCYVCFFLLFLIGLARGLLSLLLFPRINLSTSKFLTLLFCMFVFYFINSCSDSYSFSLLLFFFFLINLLIYLFLAVLGLRFCARAFSSCGKRGPLFIAVRGPLTLAASPAAEHRLQTRRLSSCGSRAQLLRGMWDLPRPGLEPACPTLAGGFSTTAPPGKPPPFYFYCVILPFFS